MWFCHWQTPTIMNMHNSGIMSWKDYAGLPSPSSSLLTSDQSRRANHNQVNGCQPIINSPPALTVPFQAQPYPSTKSGRVSFSIHTDLKAPWKNELYSKWRLSRGGRCWIVHLPSPQRSLDHLDKKQLLKFPFSSSHSSFSSSEQNFISVPHVIYPG